jgi:polysaccharide export outer membrane protein
MTPKIKDLFKVGVRFAIVLFALAFFSCSSRNITYFSNLNKVEESVFNGTADLQPIRVQKGDELEIKVTTLNPESNLLFNYGVIAGGEEVNAEAVDNYNLARYIVDSEGNIDFPILGKVNLLGLTKEESKKKLTELLAKMVTDPRVELAISNFKITVLGEVNNPSTFTVTSNRITLLEALGLAGDMTVHGKREDVLIIRETETGKKVIRVNMLDKSILNSKNYYLLQNDVVYVEAVNKKVKQADVNPTTIAILSIASSVTVALIFSFNELFN